jgi:hypothetical protein
VLPELKLPELKLPQLPKLELPALSKTQIDLITVSHYQNDRTSLKYAKKSKKIKNAKKSKKIKKKKDDSSKNFTFKNASVWALFLGAALICVQSFLNKIYLKHTTPFFIGGSSLLISPLLLDDRSDKVPVLIILCCFIWPIMSFMSLIMHS